MLSTIEDLSNELWLDILTYLKISHQFHAFANLNQRITELVSSCRTEISWKNNDEDAQYLRKHILPYHTYRENITSLRLENTKRMDLSDYADLLDFPHLHVLILHRLNITQDLLNIFRKNILHLRYLNISPTISIDKKSKRALLEMIMSLPNLQVCRLRLGIVTSFFHERFSLTSSMKNLRLTGMNEFCHTDQLTSLVRHLTCLQSLHIIANQLQFSSTTEPNDSPSISKFILNINEFNGSFVQFTDFILTLTPHVQELQIICRTPVPNLTYLNHQDWRGLIKFLRKLRKLTLDIRRSSDIDEALWDTSCQRLTKVMTGSHIVLHIGKMIKTKT